MGARLTKFEFKPKRNEEIEAIIKVAKEYRSAIHGVVLDYNEKPVKNAVVKLFLKKDSNKKPLLKPLTHTFTDECGQFLFGPLNPCTCYVIKVWYADPVCSREVVIQPEDCNYQKDHSFDNCTDTSSCSKDSEKSGIEYLDNEFDE
ncbi:transthyretin-like family protein [Clostridium sp. DL1XJH146]